MNCKKCYALLFLILYFNNVFTQDIKLKKLLRLFDKEMNYEITDETITLETLYPLSIADFEKFQKDVRDSVAIETLFFSIEEDKESLVFLKINNKRKVHPSQRELNRSMFPLNRAVKEFYTTYDHIPLLQFMRIPSELKSQFNSAITFDDRRIHYETNREITFKYSDSTFSSSAYSIFHNHWDLSKFSQSKYDIPEVLAHVLPLLFENDAPFNLKEHQYKAYLDWKSKKLNSKLKRKKIKGHLEIIPIFKIDTISFTIDGKELYNQWKISKDEYFTFIEHTFDSTVRETLFFELDDRKKANKFIHHPSDYFSEKHSEFVIFDPLDIGENRHLFHLNYNTKIKSKNPEIKRVLSKLEKNKIETLNYAYRKLNLINSIDTVPSSEIKSYRNQPWIPIQIFDIDIIPSKNEGSNSSFIQQISYEQAISFYTWKYPINKATKDSNWRTFVFPSEDEFKMMQTNLNNVISDKYFEYTNKTMKYRVEIRGY